MPDAIPNILFIIIYFLSLTTQEADGSYHLYFKNKETEAQNK